MKRLIYVSTARHTLKTSHIDDILSASRDNNRKAGITGLLVFHDGVFFQVLEGEAADVSAVFEKISRDWRHSGCRVLFDEPVVSRAFGDWSMAFRLGADLQGAQVRQLQDIRDVISKSRDGDFASSPALDVFLRAFLANFRMLDAA